MRMRMTSFNTAGIAYAADRSPEEEAIGYPVQLLRELHELKIAFAHPWLIRIQRVCHLLLVMLQIDHIAVFKKTAPLWVEPPQVEIVIHIPSSFAEHTLQYRGHDQNGRPHVEAETILLQNSRLATQPRVLLEYLNIISSSRQRTGCRKATQS
jgi:hypothetical protein